MMMTVQTQHEMKSIYASSVSSGSSSKSVGEVIQVKPLTVAYPSKHAATACLPTSFKHGFMYSKLQKAVCYMLFGVLRSWNLIRSCINEMCVCVCVLYMANLWQNILCLWHIRHPHHLYYTQSVCFCLMPSTRFFNPQRAAAAAAALMFCKFLFFSAGH